MTEKRVNQGSDVDIVGNVLRVHREAVADMRTLRKTPDVSSEEWSRAVIAVLDARAQLYLLGLPLDTNKPQRRRV